MSKLKTYLLQWLIITVVAATAILVSIKINS